MKILTLTILFACGDSETPQNETPKTENTPTQDAPQAEHAGHGDGHQMTGGAHVGKIPEGARVFFIEPKDGETVTSPFTVKMGVEGMVVKPAGAVEDGSGHHHIIIDSDPIPHGVIVPADNQHKHFGKGQTETQLTLSPNEYTLQLQFANGVHMSYGEKMSTAITINVSDGSDLKDAEAGKANAPEVPPKVNAPVEVKNAGAPVAPPPAKK